MATILTVHGTFAGGPETGEKWWQKGSPFEAQMRALVEAEDGDLTYQPFIWNGANSERSRRAAGRALFKEMQALETQGQPYSVIGHSHGGSVIAASLMESARRKHGLDYLKSWITISTPFIKTQKDRLLFSRLGAIGKSVYIFISPS